MMFTTAAYATAGRRHRCAMKPCEDIARTFEKDDLKIIVVSDGCSSSPAAVEAAALTADAIIRFLKDEQNWNSKQKAFKKAVLKELEEAYTASDAPYHLLCATVAAAAVRADGKYLLLSIGDCTVISYDVALRPSIQILPHNGKTKNDTVFGNMQKEAYESMQVHKGDMSKENISAFAVLSDGAERLIAESTMHPIAQKAAAMTILRKGTAFLSDLTMDIAVRYTQDDVSIAIVAANTVTTQSIAQKVIPKSQWMHLPEAQHVLYRETEQQAAILQALHQKPLTFTELTALVNGQVLKVVLPLLEQRRIYYDEGLFYVMMR